MKKTLLVLLLILILPLSLFAFSANAMTDDGVSGYVQSLDAITLTGADSAGATSITLYWTDDSFSYSHDGYKIYRADSQNGNYSLIKKLNYPYITSYTDENLTTGKQYYYKVCKYNDTYLNTDGKFSEVKSAKPIPSKMFFSALSSKKNQVKLTWSEAETGVDGYIVYRAYSQNGKYTQIKKIANGKALSYTDTSAKNGKFYYYKIRSFAIENGKMVYGVLSDPVRNKVDISLCQPYFIKTGPLSSEREVFYKQLRLRYGNNVYIENKDFYIYSSSVSSSDDYLLWFEFSAEGADGDLTGGSYFSLAPINKKTQINKVSIAAGGINVAWQKESGAFGYEIYRKQGSGSYSLVKTITDNDTVSWTDKYANKANTKYTYFVRAYTKAGDKLKFAKRSDALSIKRLSTPKLKSATNKKEGILFQWESVKGVKSYDVYRKTGNGSWKRIANTTDTQYMDKKTEVGTVYKYTVCCSDSEGETQLSYYNLKGITRKRYIVAEGKSQSSSSVKITWNKAKNADGYVIYRATSKNGNYRRIKTIKDKNTCSFIDKKLKFAKYYYYKVRPYSIEKGKAVYGNYGISAKVRPTVGTVTIKKAKATTPTKVKLKWQEVPKADGYQIYMASSQYGTYKKVKKLSKKSTTSYTVTGLKNANTYYFKIRSYRKVKGKTYYGDYSNIKSCYIDMLGYEGEDYFSKTKRIWGKDYYKGYTSAKSAKKDMKTIKVKTWDIDSSGKKYTRYHYLTVHKNIAYTVEKIFKEIYKGKEKFPIKSVGGYSWRGKNSSSEHCEGLAIDINPNENAQFNGATGKPMVGSFYKPGKNPYSIEENGDVVKIFRKYGFGWGDRFGNPDYMHFSYFGR